jgi:hypothetical protein
MRDVGDRFGEEGGWEDGRMGWMKEKDDRLCMRGEEKRFWAVESWTTLDFLFAPQASSESVRCRKCKEKPSIHQGDGLIRPRKGKTRNFFLKKD